VPNYLDIFEEGRQVKHFAGFRNFLRRSWKMFQNTFTVFTLRLQSQFSTSRNKRRSATKYKKCLLLAFKYTNKVCCTDSVKLSALGYTAMGLIPHSPPFGLRLDKGTVITEAVNSPFA
jgi:hypothetical protein